MQEDIKKINERLDNIESLLNSFKSANEIPLNIDNAFRSRLGLNTGGVSSASTQSIGLTGDPQTITVPAQPSGSIPIMKDGIVYYLLYK
jgi:hypothetical protein